MFWERSIALWEGDTFVGTLTHADEGTVWQIAWSPDGRLLASVESNARAPIVLWDMQAHSVAATLEEWDSVARFSPDGASLATQGWEGLNGTLSVLRIWNPAFFVYLPIIRK